MQLRLIRQSSKFSSNLSDAITNPPKGPKVNMNKTKVSNTINANTQAKGLFIKCIMRKFLRYRNYDNSHNIPHRPRYRKVSSHSSGACPTNSLPSPRALRQPSWHSSSVSPDVRSQNSTPHGAHLSHIGFGFFPVVRRLNCLCGAFFADAQVR